MAPTSFRSLALLHSQKATLAFSTTHYKHAAGGGGEGVWNAIPIQLMAFHCPLFISKILIHCATRGVMLVGNLLMTRQVLQCIANKASNINDS